MKSIELFAGAGGLAIGTALAGFDHVDVVEWDADACATMRRNAHRQSLGFAAHWNITQGDVRAYNFRKHAGQVECVFGGPPCQPFSLGGKHMGQEDCRNMFPEAVRAVREIQPKAFIFENVKGLTRQSFANYFAYIVQQLRYPTVTRRGDEEWTDHLGRLEKLHTSGRAPELHYNVVTRVLDAADYGVPQHRHRVFFVGIRSDLNVEFSFPEATHESDALLYQQWVSGEYWERHRVPRNRRPIMPFHRIGHLYSLMPNMMRNPWQTVRDAIADLPRLSAGQTSTQIANHYLNPGARSYAGHTGSGLDQPSKALKAGDHGVPGGENTLQLDSKRVRYYSVRECAGFKPSRMNGYWKALGQSACASLETRSLFNLLASSRAAFVMFCAARNSRQPPWIAGNNCYSDGYAHAQGTKRPHVTYPGDQHEARDDRASVGSFHGFSLSPSRAPPPRHAGLSISPPSQSALRSWLLLAPAFLAMGNRMPKSRVNFWRAKLEGNERRDTQRLRKLRHEGWGVAVVWECELADLTRLQRKLARFFASNPG